MICIDDEWMPFGFSTINRVWLSYTDDAGGFNINQPIFSRFYRIRHFNFLTNVLKPRTRI